MSSVARGGGEILLCIRFLKFDSSSSSTAQVSSKSKESIRLSTVFVNFLSVEACTDFQDFSGGFGSGDRARSDFFRNAEAASPGDA